MENRSKNARVGRKLLTLVSQSVSGAEVPVEGKPSLLRRAITFRQSLGELPFFSARKNKSSESEEVVYRPFFTDKQIKIEPAKSESPAGTLHVVHEKQEAKPLFDLFGGLGFKKINKQHIFIPPTGNPVEYVRRQIVVGSKEKHVSILPEEGRRHKHVLLPLGQLMLSANIVLSRKVADK